MAQLVQAEAGNQDLEGKRLVVDVLLNRKRSKSFPNTIEEIIYQEGQFGVITDGSFEKAKENISKECYQAVRMELEEQINMDILYFNTEPLKNDKNWFQHQNHWFGW